MLKRSMRRIHVRPTFIDYNSIELKFFFHLKLTVVKTFTHDSECDEPKLYFVKLQVCHWQKICLIERNYIVAADAHCEKKESKAEPYKMVFCCRSREGLKYQKEYDETTRKTEIFE